MSRVRAWLIPVRQITLKLLNLWFQYVIESQTSLHDLKLSSEAKVMRNNPVTSLLHPGAFYMVVLSYYQQLVIVENNRISQSPRSHNRQITLFSPGKPPSLSTSGPSMHAIKRSGTSSWPLKMSCTSRVLQKYGGAEVADSCSPTNFSLAHFIIRIMPDECYPLA